MNLLAFDTSTEAMSLAVQRTDVGVAGAGPSVQCWLHSGPGGALTSTLLIPAIQQLMTQAGLQFPQLDAIVFGCGAVFWSQSALLDSGPRCFRLVCVAVYASSLP